MFKTSTKKKKNIYIYFSLTVLFKDSTDDPPVVVTASIKYQSYLLGIYAD